MSLTCEPASEPLHAGRSQLSPDSPSVPRENDFGLALKFTGKQAIDEDNLRCLQVGLTASDPAPLAGRGCPVGLAATPQDADAGNYRSASYGVRESFFH